jgi:hypothetical protein
MAGENAAMSPSRRAVPATPGTPGLTAEGSGCADGRSGASAARSSLSLRKEETGFWILSISGALIPRPVLGPLALLIANSMQSISRFRT